MLSKIHISKNLARLVCLALAAVFIVSGVAKIMNFQETISYFLTFRMAGYFAALLFSSLLVSFEITLGIALLAEKNPAKPLLVCAGVMVVFTVYQLAMVLFPATFTKTCPCFSPSVDITSINWLPFFRNVLLLALSIVCYFYYRRNRQTT